MMQQPQGSQDPMIIRIDERTSNMVGAIKDVKDDVAKLRDELGKRDQVLDARYVTKTEFQAVRSIVYGMVGIVLTAFGVALASLVIGK